MPGYWFEICSMDLRYNVKIKGLWTDTSTKKADGFEHSSRGTAIGVTDRAVGLEFLVRWRVISLCVQLC